MTREPTIDGLKVIDLLDALRHLRVPSRPLCRAVNIDLDTLRDPSTRVPAAVVGRIFDEAERRSRDRLIGLHAGQQSEPRGLLSYLAMSSPRLRDGLRYFEQFSPLVIDRIDIRIEVQHATASIIFDRDGRVLDNHRHMIVYLLMATLRSLRRAVGARLRLLSVHVRHADVRDLPALSAAFGCPARIGRRDSRLVLPASELATPARLANPFIATQLERFAVALSERLSAPPASLRSRVADAARALMAAGLRADRERVARRLHLSHRTLQRRLQAEGTTFKAVRNEVVRDVSEALLSNRALKVETIALSVGFADVAAFSRAFKRWAGRSPHHHRRRLL